MPRPGRIPNRNVGPAPLRRLFRSPQGGSLDVPVVPADWSGQDVRIPNRNVGPPALRRFFRNPFSRPPAASVATPIVAGSGLWIAGTELTALGYVMANSVTIKNTAYAQTGVMSFRLDCPSGAYTPAAESAVVYAPNYPTIAYRGFIRNLKRSTHARTGRTVFEIDCQDCTTLLNDDIVVGSGLRTVVETDKQRLVWLLGQWGTKGITIGAYTQVTTASMPADDYTGKTLAEAIKMILAVSGAEFYVDNDLALHTFLTETNIAPFGLSDSPDGVTTFGYRDFNLPDETTALKNGVWITGGVGTSPTLYTNDASIASIAALTGGNGQRFATITDSSLTTQEMMDAAGNAFLLANSYPVQKGSLVTFTAGLVAGMTVQITNADHGLAATTYRISDITTTFQSNHAYYAVTFGSISPPNMASTIGGLAAGSKAITAAMQTALADAQALDFANGIIKPGIVTSLPVLPNPAYPENWLVVLTTDGKLYRNVGGSWTKAVDGGDILANTITAGQVGAGGINADAVVANVANIGGTVTIDSTGITFKDTSGVTNIDASGFGALWRRFINSGLYNSDFTGLPPSPDSDITQASASSPNVLPFWSLRFDPTTTAVSARSVADSVAPSGRVIRFTVALTPAGAQSNAIIQTVPIASERSNSLTQAVIASFRTAASLPASTVTYVRCYYVTEDGTKTGTTGLTQITPAASSTQEVRGVANGGDVPADAYSMYVEVGVFRQGGSATGYIDLCDVVLASAYSNFPQATSLPPVRLATVAALPANTIQNSIMTASANGAMANIDGTAAAVGDRILVKNETTLGNNGIYTVTDLGSSASVGIAEVTAQRLTDENGGATTLTLTYPSTPTSGNLLVACLGWRDDATVSTIPTGWALAKAGGDGAGVDSGIYWRIAGASEPRTPTWTFSASVKAVGAASEFSNGTGWLAAPVDKTNSNTATGTAGTTGLTGVLTQANELVVTSFANIGTDTWSAHDNSQTEVGEQTATGGPPGGRVDLSMGMRIVSATTSVNYGATLSASQVWSSAVATFMSAAPSGAATPWIMTRALDWGADVIQTPSYANLAGSKVAVAAGTHNIGTDWIVDSARTTWKQVGDQPGMIEAYGAAAAPAGWLLCDGTSYLRTDYPALFTAIGTTYGSVDGTHFNVPDLRDKIVLGGTPGVGGGTQSPAAALPTHQHDAPFTPSGGTGSFWAGTPYGTGAAYTDTSNIAASGESVSRTSTRVSATSGGAALKNVLVAWIIKI